ncbi:MAG: FmdB family transcriptional regulator [Chloroflexota bacterium]|nr:MAG: FmdB family transcriptional regulator [Chloroflexota bacterium]
MPTYSYKCTNCDHRFEARQRFSDDPLTECPVCGSTIRKVITPVGIVFKGSGFYVTDNKNGKTSSSLNGSGPSSKDETKDADKKVESKPTPAKSASTSDSASASSAS